MTSPLPRRAPRGRLHEELSEILRRPGPFASGVLRAVDLPAADIFDEASSVHREAIGALFEAVGRPAGGLLSFVIAGDGMTVWRLYDDEIEESRLHIGALPDLTTFLEAEQRTAHHQVVVVDDETIEIATFPRHGSPTLHRTAIESERSKAHVIAAAARASATSLVVIAAPGADVGELVRSVRPEVPIETEVVGVDTDDWDDAEGLADRVVAHVVSLAAARTVELLQLLRFARTHDLVGSDVIEVVQGIRAGRPKRLFVTPRPDDDRMAWFGPEPRQIALDLEDAAAALHDVELEQAKLIDVLVRSALMQGAEVHVVPELPEETLPGGLAVVSTVSADVTDSL